MDQRRLGIGGTGQPAAEVLDQDQREPQLAQLRLRGDLVAPAVGDPEDVVDRPSRSVRISAWTIRMPHKASGAGRQREEPEAVADPDPHAGGRLRAVDVERQVDRLEAIPAGLERAEGGHEAADQAMVDLVVLVPAEESRHARELGLELVPVGRAVLGVGPVGRGRRRRSWAAGPARRPPRAGADVSAPGPAGTPTRPAREAAAGT